MEEGLDEPFGIMLGRRPLEQDPSLSLLISRLRGPHPLEQLDVEHHGFTDFVVFNPQATLADPALGALLEANFATGVDSLAAGGRCALTAAPLPGQVHAPLLEGVPRPLRPSAPRRRAASQSATRSS